MKLKPLLLFETVCIVAVIILGSHVSVDNRN
jgi:hypothetical protein